MITSRGNFIDGQWVEATGDLLESLSPIDGKALWSGRQSSASDIAAAIAAAKAAFVEWSSRPVEERLAIIKKFSGLVTESKSEFSELIAQEIGKPKWEAVQEVGSVAGKVDPTNEAFERRASRIDRPMGAGTSVTRFVPHGVVAVIGPYNFPAHMSNGHIVPALLAGNTVVFKPSELGPLVAEFTVSLWERAGLPHGVLNLVQGRGPVGESLVKSPDVLAVFFTGSRAVGMSIIASCAATKMHALEMGGNSPLVVWDSSDIQSAAVLAVQSAFITAGQRCSSARRIIVPDNDFGQAFVSQLVALASRIVVGSPEDTPEPYFGPLRTPEQVDRVLEFQKSLLDRGAVSLIESKRLAGSGNFVTPGIVDMTPIGRTEDLEVIGPFIQLLRVADFNSAIKAAADTTYGLAAGIVTEDLAKYEQFSARVPAGLINWNQQLTGASGWAPFGGIGDSGNYRPSGNLAIDYCVYATASIEVPSLAPASLPTGIRTE